MRHAHVSVTGVVPAPAARVYAILADYHVHHPRIVPPAYFKGLEVLEGGVGAGTRTRITMRVLGSTRTFEHVVTEPEPGRVLQEAEPDDSTVTRFTVDPPEAGAGCRVTIATEVRVSGGVFGIVHRRLVPLILRPIYLQELARLTEYARSQG